MSQSKCLLMIQYFLKTKFILIVKIAGGVYGTAENGRCLTIFFTIRSKKIRIISARDQGKNEKINIKKYKSLETK